MRLDRQNANKDHCDVSAGAFVIAFNVYHDDDGWLADWLARLVGNACG